MRIFLRRQLRSLILVSNGYALSIRYVTSHEQCLISYTPVSQVDLTNYEETQFDNYSGLIGFLNVNGSVFLCVVTDSLQIASPRPSEMVYKVKEVEFFCLNTNEYDTLQENRYTSKNAQEKYENEHPCCNIRKLLISGFYYSRDFDLTNNLQERGLNIQDYHQMYINFDKKYLWNYFMMSEMLKFRDRILDSERQYLDRSEFLTFLIRGFVKTVNTQVGEDESLITLISKVSCAKSDGPFGLKGVDEDGYVSNSIETEILLYDKSNFLSYTQVRGNIPLFYEIEDQMLSNRKIHFTQNKQINEIAFDKHFDTLQLKHGNVVVVSCLKGSTVEEELSRRYRYFLNNKKIPNLTINFSREQLKNFPHKVLFLLKEAVLDIGAFCYDIKKKVYIGKQLGVFRINSLNSMEKPGIVEKIISREVLKISLKEMGAELVPSFKIKHDLLWDENNVALETIYEKSLRRKWKKSFQSITQNQVQLHDPFHDYISEELSKREQQFLSKKDISIFAGSFNVSAETSDQDISSWINPNGKSSDIVVIGLEEVVELTTSKMLVIDVQKKIFWITKIKKTLNQNFSDSHYSLVWTNQLGGIVLLLFVKDSELPNIKEIEGMIKKTGLGGMGANKGGVAVSFAYSSTRFCCIVSHLAAGLENVEQRHNDYKTIAKNMRFGQNRRIKDHDAVIWVGDFNFRILLSNDKVRSSIKQEEITELLEHDQLIKQMVAGESFPYFNEMEIKFPPTYKFDKGTKNYDTSDKLRIPAWTDRIVSRGNILQQTSYSSAQDITFSDHRPVYATFKATVTVIDEGLKNNLTKDLYEKRKQEIQKNGTDDYLLKNLVMAKSKTPTSSLPPPSSYKSKWWIDGGQQVKVSLEFPENAMINPLRESNPFKDSSEPEVIYFND